MQTGLGMAGASLLAAPVFGQPSGAELTYMTPSTLSLAYAPEFHADVAGIYGRNGVRVRLEVGRGGAQAIQLVAGNQIHIGRAGGDAYMAARAAGNSDVIAFGTIAQTSPFLLVSAAKAPLRRTEDLEGKVIGLPSFGGTAEVSLNLMLAKARVAPASVRREKVAYSPATFGLIEAGRLHGFFANTSAVARMQAERMHIHVMDIDDDVPGNVYVAREENLNRTPEPYVAFTRSVMQAARELAAMDDKALTEALVRIRARYDVPGLDKLDVALQDVKATRPLWTTHGVDKVVRNDEKQWEEARRLLEGAGVIKSTSRAMYTNDIWNKAAK